MDQLSNHHSNEHRQGGDCKDLQAQWSQSKLEIIRRQELARYHAKANHRQQTGDGCQGDRQSHIPPRPTGHHIGRNSPWTTAENHHAEGQFPLRLEQPREQECHQRQEEHLAKQPRQQSSGLLESNSEIPGSKLRARINIMNAWFRPRTSSIIERA